MTGGSDADTTTGNSVTADTSTAIWHRRAAAALALAVVGAALVAAFGFALSGGLPEFTYAAQQVDPETDAGVVANASDEILNLDRKAARNPGMRPAFETAARRGVFEGTYRSPNHTGDLYLFADDADATYAVYEGRYYRWNSTTRPENDFVRVRLDPVSAETVMDDLAVPYAEASSATRRVVRNETSRPASTPNESVVVRNGTYYAVDVESEASVFARLLAAVGLFVASVPGRAYLGCGFALTALLRSGDCFPLGARRALGAAAWVLPMSLALTVFSSGSAVLNYVVIPGVATVVALGLPLGALLRRWRRRRVAAIVAGVWLGVLVLAGVVASTLGVLGTLLGLGFVSVAGLPLVPYGYYLTDPT